MKIAITTSGQDMQSHVSERFGRAPWIMFVDTATGQQRAVPNEQNSGAAQGAGIQTAQMIAQLGVEAVLTGHCGPKAYQTLKAAGVDVYLGVTGNVGDTIDEFTAGTITASASADVEGHWS